MIFDWKKDKVCACNTCGVLFKPHDYDVGKQWEGLCETHAKPLRVAHFQKEQFLRACEDYKNHLLPIGAEKLTLEECVAKMREQYVSGQAAAQFNQWHAAAQQQAAGFGAQINPSSDYAAGVLGSGFLG